MSIERPEIVEEKHLDFLDALRESGITNMWGASPYLEDAFDISDKKDAEIILIYWMKSFSERRKEIERHGTG